MVLFYFLENKEKHIYNEHVFVYNKNVNKLMFGGAHMEIEELVKKAKSKDEKAMNELIKRFTPLILKMTSSIYIKGSDREDLIQIGYLTIMKAVEGYKIDSKIGFTAYVSNAIKNNYYYSIRKVSKENYDTSYEKLLDEGKALKGEEALKDSVEERVIKKEEHENLNKALNKLTKEERELITFAYKRYGGLKEYSIITGIKYVTLQKRKKSILKKLRKLL